MGRDRLRYRLEPEQARQARAFAARDGIDPEELVRRAIEEYLRRHEEDTLLFKTFEKSETATRLAALLARAQTLLRAEIAKATKPEERTGT